jgi:hypothetical protein
MVGTKTRRFLTDCNTVAYNCLLKLSSADASCCSEPWASPPACEAADDVCCDRLIRIDEISLLSGLPLCSAFFNDVRPPLMGLLSPRALIQLLISEAPSVGDTLEALPLRACTVCWVSAVVLFCEVMIKMIYKV